MAALCGHTVISPSATQRNMGESSFQMAALALALCDHGDFTTLRTNTGCQFTEGLGFHLHTSHEAPPAIAVLSVMASAVTVSSQSPEPNEPYNTNTPQSNSHVFDAAREYDPPLRVSN